MLFNMNYDSKELIRKLTDFARSFSTEFRYRDYPAENEIVGRRKTRSPENVEAILAKQLRKMAVKGVVKCFRLDRCAFVLQDSKRAGVWTIHDDYGIPSQIRKNSGYTRSEGLTGLVLQGTVVVSDDILNDPRRSKRHGDKWIGSIGKADSSCSDIKSYVGVPIWKQASDGVNTCVGAFYGIRAGEKFSADEVFIIELVAQVVSFGQDRLRSWRNRVESDIRQLQLSRLWRMPISDREKYQKLLEFIQNEFPFARLLLSLVDASSRKINGVAALGFRSDIVSETNRDIIHSEKEDILSMVFRKKSPQPLFVEPGSKDWEKVDRITSFRHQVRNPLLLIPMMSRKGGVLGILLIELPTGSKRPSYFEVQRLSLFVNHAGSLVEGHRSAEHARSKRTALNSMERKCRRISSELDPKYQAKQLRQIVRVMCEHFGFKTAILYRVDSSNSVLFGDTGYGLNSTDIFSRFIPISPNLVSSSLPLAIQAFHQSETCRYNKNNLDRHPDPSIPSPLLGYSSNLPANREDEQHGVKKQSRSLPVNIDSIQNGRCIMTNVSQGVFASPVLSGTVCMGVLVYSAPSYTEIGELKRATAPFFSIIGHSLSIMESTSRLVAAERQAAAFKSFALAATELTTCISVLDPETPDRGLRSTVWKSMLKDVASMFDAALAHVFCFKDPIVLDNQTTDFSKIQGEVLYEEGCFVVDESDLPSHFFGRVISTDGVPPRTIKIGEQYGLTQSVLLSLRPVRSDNIEQDQSWSRTMRELNGPRAFAGFPLVMEIDGKTFVYGVLTLTRLRIDAKDSRVFRYEEIQTLSSIAYLVSSALAQEELIASKTGHMMQQVHKCLRWFRHDIPGMITNIGGMIDGLSEVEDIASGLIQLKDLTEATRSVFLACAIGLGEKPAISKSREIVSPDFRRFHDYAFELVSIQKKVELLFAFKSDLKGDTKLRFSISPEGCSSCTGIWSTPVLYACFALVDNALTACLQNKTSTSKDAPGNVVVNLELKHDELVISVANDAGGLKGKQLTTISRELYSGWSKDVGGDHSGMGLHIVSRIVKGLLRGTLEADDMIHAESNRVGAVFTARIPRSFD